MSIRDRKSQLALKCPEILDEWTASILMIHRSQLTLDSTADVLSCATRIPVMALGKCDEISRALHSRRTLLHVFPSLEACT